MGHILPQQADFSFNNRFKFISLRSMSYGQSIGRYLRVGRRWRPGYGDHFRLQLFRYVILWPLTLD